MMQNDVSPELKYRIRLAIEELVQQILMPVYEQPYIRVNAEYSPKEGECTIDISYRGERYDIQDTDNELSLAMLKNTVRNMEYSFNEEDDTPNRIRAWIRR